MDDQNSTKDPKSKNYLKFPYPSEMSRIREYSYNKRLFKGEHYDAFNIKIDDAEYSKEYQRLRYITANFPALISKVTSDLNFIEPPKIQVKDGDQAFISALTSENKMRIQNYESSLMNSYFGDMLYKIRVGKRHPNNPTSSLIIEQVSPRLYFPMYDQANTTGEPIEQELAWVITIGEKKYLRKEIHSPGSIRNKLYELEGSEHLGYTIVKEEDIKLVGKDLLPEQKTGIDRSLLIHIPNWGAGESHFGTSDYNDLDSLFYGINNRLSKVDNILDKHGDPILTVPKGIIDEDGKVKKKALGVIEMAEGEDGKPEYVVWDAKLESAFTEIEKMIDITCMISETSPVIAGIDKGGVVESGRALKYKMLRSLAKAQRKQLYWTVGLTEVYYVAQLVAQEYKLEVDGVKLTQKPVKPEIIWSDGLPADTTELIDNETKRIDAGLTTKVDAIMRLDDVDEDIAKQKAAEIDKENTLELTSQMKVSSQFAKPKPNGFPVN